jgi:hypothetical protein
VSGLVAGAQRDEKRGAILRRSVEYRVEQRAELAPLIRQQWSSGVFVLPTAIMSHHPAKQHLRFRPVALHRSDGDAEGFGCFSFAQTAEEAAFDHVTQTRLNSGQSIERLVQLEQHSGLIFGGNLVVIERYGRVSSVSFLG